MGAVDVGELQHAEATGELVLGADRLEEVPAGRHVVARVEADERAALFLGELDAYLGERRAEPSGAGTAA